MLEPQNRTLLLRALQPPEGFSLDQAIGTSFSLDLLALLATPLAFTLFDVESADGRPTTDPLALLESLRRHARHITLFCQAGQIYVPPHDRLLYGYLEESVVEVTAPRRGVFHPKIWLLKFTSDDEPACFRLLCSSRNLTFDRSWDAVVRLDGQLANRRTAISVNHPLGDFVAALPELAVHGLPPDRRAAIETIAQEVRRVRWDPPDGFDDFSFRPLGHTRRAVNPFQTRIDRLLVISPFLSADALRALAQERDGNILVSRLESVQELEPADLSGYEDIRVLAEGAQPELEDDDAESGSVELVGLHAKVYVADQGWNATVWIGSANATNSALSRNVEFLVELAGRKKVCGIDAVLEGRDGIGLGSLLAPFDRADSTSPVDPAERSLEREVDTLRHAIAAVPLQAQVFPLTEPERYEVRLVAQTPLQPLLGAATVRAWPVTQSENAARLIHAEGLELARFPDLTTEMLTPFIAFQLAIERDGRVIERRFAVRSELVGAPADREQRLFRALLRNRNDVLRYLMLLLADDPAAVLNALGSGPNTRDDGTSESRDSVAIPVLFEGLVRALEQSPDRLDHIARLVKDLRAGESDAVGLLPEGFDEIWTPIERARQELSM